ncbi:MAG: sulfatase [Candidatus Hydrogenedentes bacterium]|nr:sulfatase [Candidatus Hydrogenedentota bacterium]
MSNPGQSRRAFLMSAAAGALVLGGGAASGGAGRPRNVLFISMDDLNDWTGYQGGHPDVKTPNLDRLAARGTAFTHTYCPAPLCNASRAALMTGIIPSRSGVYMNDQDWRKSPVLSEAATLSQHFMANGYSARGAGKIYHGPFQHPASWQAYWPSQDTCKPDDPNPPSIPWQGGGAASRHFDWGPLDVDDSAMGDGQVAAWVSAELSKPREQPFFLACGIFRPHLPWYAPKKYFDMYPLDEVTLPETRADDLDDVPAAGRAMARTDSDHKRVVEHDQWRRAVQGYLASISFADAQVGHVLDALDASPHRDDTLVVLWSDHGWHLGEKLHWRKFALWEEATKNGMIFAGSGIPAGQRCATPVGLIDIYPTLTDLCGLPARDGLDGRSLRPLLEDPAAAWERPAVTTYGRGNHSARSARWRYIRYADGSEELYDHDADPLEWTNLAGRDELASVKADLARWFPASDADFGL